MSQFEVVIETRNFGSTYRRQTQTKRAVAAHVRYGKNDCPLAYRVTVRQDGKAIEIWQQKVGRNGSLRWTKTL
jgi:hypothetical protein